MVELMLRRSGLRVSGPIGWYWALYLLPALFFYTLFMAYPLLDSIRMSFFGAVGAPNGHGQAQTFVGFDNYIKLFGTPLYSRRYWGAFGHTWYFFFIHMLVQNSLGLLFSVLLMNKGLRGRAVYRTVIFIPATLAVLVTGYLWKLILNPQWGAVNIILDKVGLSQLALPWLGEARFALTAISVVSAWQWVGMPTMMFLAGLQNISDDLIEASEIAGATAWQTFWHVKLPMLRPVLGIVAVLTFVNNFNAFDVVFAMEDVNGAPLYATDIMGTLFYRIGIAGEHPVSTPDPPVGAAIATVTFLILAVGVAIALRLTQTREER